MTGVAAAAGGPSLPRRIVLKRLAACFAPLAWSGCASPPDADDAARAREAERAAADALAARGYRPDANADIQTYFESWPAPGGALSVALVLPRAPGAYPLVLYLPDASAALAEAARWRETWARAGYAVALVQRGADGDASAPGAMRGAAAPRRPDAADSDAANTGQEGAAGQAKPGLANAGRPNGDRASAEPPPDGDRRPDGPPPDGAGAPAAMRPARAGLAPGERADLARTALEELARRARAGTAPYDRVDAGRIALAGFDAGAQAALALAGDRAPGLAPAPVPAGLRALVLLSPPAHPGSANLGERYAALRLPVLGVTGGDDADPDGRLVDPYARKAAFAWLPPGGKLLLDIADGNHDTMAARWRDAQAGQRRKPPAGRPERGGAGGPPGGGGGMSGSVSTGIGTGMGGGMGEPGAGMGSMGGMGGGPSGMGGGRPGGKGGAPDDRDGAQPAAAVEPLRQYVLIEHVSLAFLDAYVKDDPVALEWLARNAPRWMAPLARLQSR